VNAAKGVVRIGTAVLATVLALAGLMGTTPPAGTQALAQPADDASIHRRWLEAIGRGDVDAALAFFTDDGVFDDAAACGWPFMCVGPLEARPRLEALTGARTQISEITVRRFATRWSAWTTVWFEVRSDATRAAGVDRIQQAVTVTLRGEKIVSVSWRSNRGDAQTGRFLAAQPRPPAPTFRRPEPAPHGRFVDVGGRKVYIECLGSGSPTVVFEAGLDPVGGASGRTWVGVEPRPLPQRNIHGDVANRTRACTYDRPGIGLSDRGPTPRDGLRAVQDLRQALRSAGERPPFVLVGWSLGAPLAYLFASQYRHEVAGLVLLDPAVFPFDFNERLWAMLPADLAQQDRARTQRFYENMIQPGFLEGGWDAPATAAHLRGTPPLGDIPLIVLIAGKPLTNPYDLSPASFIGPQPGWSPELIAQREQLRLEVQADPARRVPRGRHIIVDSSDHLLWRFVPQKVTATILEVVEAARRSVK